MTRLQRLVSMLRKHHGAPAELPPMDAYQLLLMEEVAYLADDATRLAAWRMLEDSVGTSLVAILGASAAKLRAACRKGGAIGVSIRAERLRTIAGRVFETWRGSPDFVARLSVAEARRELARFPGVGLAGADRTMLLAGTHAVFALDSNALRVLQRLGYGSTTGNWNRDYAAAQAAAGPELPRRVRSLRTAFLLLRSHGRVVCRRGAPRCNQCPLVHDCPTGRKLMHPNSLRA